MGRQAMSGLRLQYPHKVLEHAEPRHSLCSTCSRSTIFGCRPVAANMRTTSTSSEGLVADGPLKSPEALHPVFCGNYDWHSAVHSHW
eukprot:767436-Hanusia_phi.AAC.4